jgi:lysine-N-methylase
MQLDEVTQKRYQMEAPELMESVTGSGESAIMKRDPKTDYCVKFEGGLCGIQRDHGEQFLGDACYFYPRSTRTLGGDTLLTATLSCPEIARLSLLSEGDAFADADMTTERVPTGMQDYLPEGLNPTQAAAIHKHFMDTALREDTPPERSLMHIYTTAQSLSRITAAAWPDAVPFYLQHADASLPAPAPSATDSVYLLQALCGLVAAAKYVHHARLIQTIQDMERALHVTIRWDTLAIATLPDSGHATQALHARWRGEWQARYTPLLRRYLAMQISLALFPFAGFGPTLPERAAVIGIRYATVRLALMSILQASNGAPPESDVIRVVQSISRFLDHLAEAEFSLKIYKETGWLQANRLRGLLEMHP